MLNVASVFSALGNNASLTPIIVKDTLSNAGVVTMAYKQGSKESKQAGLHDARERFIEDNTTSLVWLGGIPLLKKVFDKGVANNIFGFRQFKDLGKDALAKTNAKLLNQENVQNLASNLQKYSDEIAKSPKLKGLTDEAGKVLSNVSKFKKMTMAKAAFATLIPLGLLGFVLPKLNQLITKNACQKEQKQKQADFVKMTKTCSERAFKGYEKKHNLNNTFASFISTAKDSKGVSFTGLGNKLVDIFNSNVANMAILDSGIATGRVATARNDNEAWEKGLREAGLIFFIYKGGDVFAKLFNKIGNALKTPINLDSKILTDKSFQESVKKAVIDPQYKKQFLSFVEGGEKEIINMIDDQIKAGGLKTETLKFAQKLGLIDVIDDVRNPLKYVQTGKIASLNKDIKNFVKAAVDSGNPEKLIKKVVRGKRLSIIANLGVCVAATAYFIPKALYWFREKVTGTPVMPGLEEYSQKA